MAEASIKRLIIARFLENLKRVAPANPQPGEPYLRKVERVTDLTVAAAVTPSVQMAVSDESVVSEDFQGWELEFLIAIKINISSNAKDAEGDPRRYDEADELVQQVQAVIENDLQLKGPDEALATMLEYQGEQPFTNEVNAPLGGSIVFYKVKYRRYRGAPDRRY